MGRRGERKASKKARFISAFGFALRKWAVKDGPS